jgi:hypothetical protein
MGPEFKVNFSIPINGFIEVEIKYDTKIKFKANSKQSDPIKALFESLLCIIKNKHEHIVSWESTSEEKVLVVFSKAYPEPYVKLEIKKIVHGKTQILFDGCTSTNGTIYPFYKAIKKLESKITKDEFASDKGWGHPYPEAVINEIDKLSMSKIIT